MAIFGSKDPVAAARAELEAAEAAVKTEGRRVEAAREKIAAFAADAAGLDPDADAKGFAKATRDLAELRATHEILRSREAGAVARVEAARVALAAAEDAQRRSRVEELDASISERAERAAEALRDAVRAFGAELQALSALSRECMALAQGIEPRLKARHVRGVVTFAGNPVGAINDLARRGQL